MGPPKIGIPREYEINGTLHHYLEDDEKVLGEFIYERYKKILKYIYKNLGCPSHLQTWCETSPALGIPEFVIGYFLGVIGYKLNKIFFLHFITPFVLRRYPIGVTLIQTIFSKILGSRPQGTWYKNINQKAINFFLIWFFHIIRMGIMLAAGSVSRIIGPVMIVSAYTRFGTGWTFGAISIFMTIPMILLYILKNRLTIETSDEVTMTERNAQQA